MSRGVAAGVAVAWLGVAGRGCDMGRRRSRGVVVVVGPVLRPPYRRDQAVVVAVEGVLVSRRGAQDTADHLRALLSLYPSAKGLAPIACVAPEAIHTQEDVRYVFIAGPPFWRDELASASLRSGKDVVVAPPCTAAQARELADLADFEGQLALLYNEISCAPSVDALRALLGGDRGGLLGPASRLRVRLHLAPPLCCTAGHPTAAERTAVGPGGWWGSRARGGGALGAAGVQAFELLQHLTASPLTQVRATFHESRADVDPERDGAGAAGTASADAAPECCDVEARLANGARAELRLDWRAVDGAPPPALLQVDGPDGHARLDLISGRLEVSEAVREGAPLPEGTSPRVVCPGEGGGLWHEAHGTLAYALMRAQIDGPEGADLSGPLAPMRGGDDWQGGSVACSYAAVEACYRSDADGGGWCWVQIEGAEVEGS